MLPLVSKGKAVTLFLHRHGRRRKSQLGVKGVFGGQGNGILYCIVYSPFSLIFIYRQSAMVTSLLPVSYCD